MTEPRGAAAPAAVRGARVANGPGAAGAAPTGPGTEPGLVRAVGRWAMVGLMINAIVGAGIFGLPSRVDALIGAWGPLAILACALVMAGIALCFAEVSSRFAVSGGPYLYTRGAFGPLAGFLVGWLMWVTRLTTLAAISNVLASYSAFLWPPAAAGGGRAAVIAGVTVIFTAVNLAGVRQGAATAAAFAVAKLVPLVGFVGLGLIRVEPSRLALAALPATDAFGQAVLILIFAFAGFEATVVAAGESRAPRRDLPFAVLAALGTAALLYVLIQVVCVGTLPELAASERPLADAAARLAGPWAGSAIAAGAVVSILGTLSASLLVGPRVLYAMAEQGEIPALFARTHARFHTPHVAILVTAAGGLALALSGTFVHLLTLSVIARLTAYLGTSAALLAYRRRDDAPPPRFTVRGGIGVVVLTWAACLWLLSRSGARELRDVGIAVALGAVAYALHTGRRRRRGR